MTKTLVALFLLAIAVIAWSTSVGDAVKNTREIHDRNNDGNPERIVDSVVDGTNLVRRTVISDTNDDGVPDQKIISCYRNGKKACMFWRHMDQSNRTTRIFISEGRQVLMDDDENGDGYFETMFIFGTNGIPSAVFKIDKEGIPSPAPEDEFNKYVEEFSFGNEVIKPFLQTIVEVKK